MSSLLQIAAPTNKNAMQATDGQSSTSASSGEGKDGAFSSHLKAQQYDNQNKANDSREVSRSAGKPTGASAEAESSSPHKAQSAENNVRKNSSELGSPAPAKHHALHSGRQKDVPANYLEEKEVALSTMGEQVLALLEPDDAAKIQPAAVEPLAVVASGNESPPEDRLLPQAGVERITESITEEPADTVHPTLEMDGAELEGALVEGEVLAASDQQIAAGVSHTQAAAVVHQGAQVSSTPVSQSQTDGLLSRSGPALSNAMPELLRSAQGKQSVVLNEAIDSEVDLESDLAPNIGKTVKGALLEGSTPKPPATPQMATDALSNGPAVPKDNFEQVRQNIMKTLAGRPDASGPVSLAVSSGVNETGEAPASGVSFSTTSATLAAVGTEPPKYMATQESSPPRFFTLQTPAGQPGWDVEVGSRIRWMLGQNNSGVELRLNPPELGSIEVKVATEGERTSVTFFAANPAARDALELALPRLRDMFVDSGMQLANADVSDQGLQQEREQLSGSEGLSASGDSGETMLLDPGSGLISEGRAEGRSVIDYYI